ncbi:hypothetical protein ACVWZV_004487 [Bradyrhizobium sp. GM5.1]
MTLLTALTGLRTNNLVGLAAPLTFFRKSLALHALVLVLGQSELQTGLSLWGKVTSVAKARIPPAGSYSLLTVAGK